MMILARIQSPVRFSLLAFSLLGTSAHCADKNTKDEGVPFGHKLILEDAKGGSDSSVSPDGKWLAYTSRRSGNLDVWLVEIESGKARQMTTNSATDNEPRWHPNGTHLVFVTQRDGSQDVYTLEIATGKQTPIATEKFNEDYPSFSRDGSEICFTGGPQGSREVKVYNFESGKTRTLTKGFGYIGATNFSPDGKQLVFHAYYDNSYGSGKSDLFVIPTTGGEPVNITKQRDTWDYKPNWSYNGKWLTFSSKRATPNFNLWLIRPDGSELKSLTNVEGSDLRWSNWTRDGRIGWHRINRNPRSVGYFISTKPVYELGKPVEIKTGKTSSARKKEIAAEFQLPDFNGTLHRLADLRGKATILYFWSTLRECESDLKMLEQLRQEFEGSGVSIIGLACDGDSNAEVQSILERSKVQFQTVICNKQVRQDYGVATYPTTFLIDDQGRIEYWLYGILDEKHWEMKIQKLAGPTAATQR